MNEWVTGTDDPWPGARVLHVTYNGQPATVKIKADGNDALMAIGHHSNLLRGGPSHVHVWQLTSGDLRLHDVRAGAPIFPNIRDDEKTGRQAVYQLDQQHDELIRRAERLAANNVNKDAVNAARSLDKEWRQLPNASAGKYQRFRALMDQIFEANRVRVESLKRDWATNKSAKERVVSRAESLANSSDLRSASDQMKAVFDEWKRIGPCEKSDNDRLWSRFKAAQDRLHERKKRELEERKRAWAANKSAKERVASRAESLANSSDLRSASDQMKAVFDEWKRIGPCEKSDNDRLWSRFKAAQDRLHERKKREFEERKRNWGVNKARKEELIRQMAALRYASDFRVAKEQARSLSEQWRAAGPCEKTDNDRLWDEFKSAKDQVFAAAKADAERRQNEWRAQAWQRLARLEDQLRNVESAIIRTNEAYSRALSARSPSMRNPNYYSIVASQQTRQANLRDKLVSLSQRKSELVNKIIEARGKASG